MALTCGGKLRLEIVAHIHFLAQVDLTFDLQVAAVHLQISPMQAETLHHLRFARIDFDTF